MNRLILMLIILLPLSASSQIITTNYIIVHDFSEETSQKYETLSVLEVTGTFLVVDSPIMKDTWYYFSKIKKIVLARNKNGELALIGSYNKKGSTLIRVTTSTKYYDFYAISNSKKNR